MLFLPISLALFFFLILLLPILIFLVQIKVIEVAFYRLGLNPTLGVLFFFLCLIGSTINIPILKRKVAVVRRDEALEFFRYFFGFTVPEVQEQVLAINVGGALMPALLCLYLLPKAPPLAALISIAVIALVAKVFSRPVRGIGIALPPFIPPIASALLALLLVPSNPAPIAYISGVLGTLIGADLLNLPTIRRMMQPGIMSIGGAGVFDGIYLVGIIAVLIS